MRKSIYHIQHDFKYLGGDTHIVLNGKKKYPWDMKLETNLNADIFKTTEKLCIVLGKEFNQTNKLLKGIKGKEKEAIVCYKGKSSDLDRLKAEYKDTNWRFALLTPGAIYESIVMWDCNRGQSWAKPSELKVISAPTPEVATKPATPAKEAPKQPAKATKEN